MSIVFYHYFLYWKAFGMSDCAMKIKLKGQRVSRASGAGELKQHFRPFYERRRGSSIFYCQAAGGEQFFKLNRKFASTDGRCGARKTARLPDCCLKSLFGGWGAFVLTKSLSSPHLAAK
jgi:hypothetical protein